MAVLVGELRTDGEAPWIYGKWVQPPVQGRSARTFFKFLDTAEEQLSERHWHEVSIADLVRGADASVGSFYNRFTDKEALLNCLIDRLDNECALTVDSIREELELCPTLYDEAPGLVISFIMRLCTDRGGVLRALDITHRLSKPHDVTRSFAGLTPGFEDALQALVDSARLGSQLSGFSRKSILRAFREAYWVARDSLLYSGKERFDDIALHRSLMRHFWASLEV